MMASIGHGDRARPAISHLSGRVGNRFEVTVRGYRLSLTLDAAQDLPGSPRPGGGFRLEFVGPPDPVS